MQDLEFERQKYREVKEEVNNVLKQDKEELDALIANKKRKEHEDDRMLMLNTKYQKLKKAKDKLYFSRIDVDGEKIYIGKKGTTDTKGNILITDWRAPIAALYYDSNLGDVEYKTPMGMQKAKMSLKRQIVIEDEEVQGVYDVETVSNDDFLKPYLNGSADNRLKNIVSTIQEEQNNIIRNPMNKNIIVQGSAGSGKTTVALHKIAYLVYRNEDKYKMHQYLIIGPNKVFINYISTVLPDLDVENSSQFTFEEFAKNYIDEKFTVSSSHKKLVDHIHGQKIGNESKIKSSLMFMSKIAKYMNALENGFFENDLNVDKLCLFKKEEIKKVYASYPGTGVMHKIKQTKAVLKNRVKYQYENIYDRILATYRNVPKTKENLDEAYYLKEKLKKGFLKEINEYFPKSDFKVLNLYKDFLQKENAEYFAKTIKNIDNKQLEFEDLAACMYIRYRLAGVDYLKQYVHTVIDEAQDFGEFNFWILKKLLVNSTFAIFGDVAQGIYAYRGIENWDVVSNKVFKEDCEVIKMKKSYRTSVEIMTEANNITRFLNLDTATPVVRHADKVNYLKIKKEDETKYLKEKIEEYLGRKYKSIAVICKTNDRCKEVADNLKKVGVDATLLTDDSDNYSGNITVLTSYLAKGLEFDAVLLMDADETVYDSTSPLDMKLIYVAMTRALHSLNVLYNDEITVPLRK